MLEEILQNKTEKQIRGYVYYYCIPPIFNMEKLYPTIRQEELDNCSGEVKKEKYFVWKLLECALRDVYGLDIKEVEFRKTEYGKWECDKCYFSLSHRKGYVVVAVSNKPIGVDIEKKHVPVNNFENKILNEKEFNLFKCLNKKEESTFLISMWAKKESIFKILCERRFIPKNIDTTLFYSKLHLIDDFVIAASSFEQMEIIFKKCEMV